MVHIGKNAKAEELEESKQAEGNSVYLICYTSGTTGLPKGVILTQKGVTSNYAGMDAENIVITETDTLISYLPLAHVFEQLV